MRNRDYFTTKLKLKPTRSFNFDLSARIFSDGDVQIQRYQEGVYWQVIRIDGRLILSRVMASESFDGQDISVELNSNQEISAHQMRLAGETISSIFNMKMELRRFYEEIRDDRTLSAIASKLKGLRSPTTPTVFEALVSSIVEQQIALNVALGMENRVVKAFGEPLRIGSAVYYAFPTSPNIMSATDEQLRKCGLSQRKVQYIKGISRAIVDGEVDLEKFKSYEDTSEIIRELDAIRGVGVWTAELTTIRGMRRMDAFPADDLGVRRCISHYYTKDRRISAQEARAIAEKWGKWKGLASFYLIMAEALGLKAEPLATKSASVEHGTTRELS